MDQLRCKIDFIYSGSLLIKTFKSNLSNLHISPILSISLLVISKLFDIFGYVMFQTNLLMLSKIIFLLLSITNLLFVIFVILQSKKKLPFPLSASKSKKYFDLIHVDVWEPYSSSSIHVHKYFLTIVDDYSRYTWVFPLKQKSKVVKILENFVVFIQIQFKKQLK